MQILAYLCTLKLAAYYMKSYLLILFGCILLAGCEVEYHPYDTRIEGETDIHASHIAQIEEQCKGRTSLRFAVISDTQRWYDETEDAVAALNKRDDIDFVIHAGDIADFGLRAEFERQRDILNGLKVPYIVVIGNHDCIATGEDVYQEMFGPLNFSFSAGDTRFVCLNTNSLEFDRTESVPDLMFIEKELRDYPAECKKSFVVMHAAPDSEQFDKGLTNAFHRHVKAFPGLQCCIHGHGHGYVISDIFDDGVLYIMCPNIEKRAYILFTVNDDGYEFEQVFF